MSAQTRFEYGHQQMGTQIRLILYASDSSFADSVSMKVFERIDVLNQIFSDYIEDSELNRLNRSASETMDASNELYDVLRLSKEISKNTHGAFDITVGPLISLWRVARSSKKLPSDVAIQNALKKVGFEYVYLLDNSIVRLRNKGMQLDLGGIGKGFAADEAIKVLEAHGITSALIDMGGDIVVGDPPPNKEFWTLAFSYSNEDGNEIVQKIKLRNKAIATSGDLYQFIIIDGARYSHIIDPKTGMALSSRVQATVIAPNGALADSHASAFSVMGISKTSEKIGRLKDLDTFITAKTSDGYRQWNSGGFEDYTIEN